jgi:nitric oxide reductase subunit B
MMRLWFFFGMVLLVSFAILGWIGVRIDPELPPIADKVVTIDLSVVIDEDCVGTISISRKQATAKCDTRRS